MLEKIGLPAKPSQRGNNWVIDASHCQGCNSQFTFINRKHHCRRCGGLFCNTCTQQRMVLRGQGDSPVRICDPCKKLEEAARFELRHGRKARASKGSSKMMSMHDDEVLNQILGNDRKESFSGVDGSVRLVSSIQRATSSPSCPNAEGTSNDGQGVTLRGLSTDESNHLQNEMGSASPEELRQRALDEKRKYKILKGEGKPEEALRAFKRGKDLERQAEALEIYLRKSRRKAMPSGSIDEIQNRYGLKDSSGKNKLPQTGKEKDDLATELRELGWSDMDLRDADKKSASMSLEGELTSLLGEFSKRTDTNKDTPGIDKSEVVAHKKRALMLKREGNLAEAKEELKRAKLLEKRLEEQEILAEAEDSDDELSSLLRSMDSSKQDDLPIGYEERGFDFDHLMGVADDLGVDSNFEVTDEEMEDPEIAAALESLGWTKDSNHPDDIVLPPPVPIDKESLSSEILSLKREALNQKRAGNVAEAMAQLKKAKLLEKDLESLESQDDKNIQNHSFILKDSASQGADKLSKSSEVDEVNVNKGMDLKPAPKSKLMIQKELLGLKKKALALRREGRLDEAEEELKKGSVLENQLAEMDNNSKAKVSVMTVTSKDTDLAYEHPGVIRNLPLGEEGEDVTDKDLHDPTYLSLLRNLGWKDEDKEFVNSRAEPSKQNDNQSVPIIESFLSQTVSSIPAGASRRSKAEIQRELLGLKRKALTLRRQGKTEEAEEVLRMTKELEDQMMEMDAPKTQVQFESNRTNENIMKPPLRSGIREEDVVATEKDMHPSLLSMLNSVGWQDEEHEHLTRKENSSVLIVDSSVHSADVTAEKGREMVHTEKEPHIHETNSVQGLGLKSSQSSLQQEILAHKRKAVALKREGKLTEAKEELRQAKLLEKSQEEDNPQQKSDLGSDVLISSTSNVPSVEQKEQSSLVLATKPLSSRDRFKLQQESLGHKRKAMKLRREGCMEEAEAEFELAKTLESQLEELTFHDSTKLSVKEVGSVDDVGVEDLLDPQLLSALKAIGLENTITQAPEKAEPAKLDKGKNSNQERIQLEEQIKAEKVQAVNLKRSGKPTEALDALRRAKVLEKKLNSVAIQ